MAKKIKVKRTRDKNQIIEIDFEEYIFGVVASEVGNAHVEACKAQAVAARTAAMPYVTQNKTIDDANIQAFKLERVDSAKYPNAYEAVQLTAGEVLYYEDKIISPCSYSASNGGRTTSSKSRWGGDRPYLIEQDDKWDYAATKGKKTGHGVGMSQEGAMYAAKKGHSYTDILSFYYPGTRIYKEEQPLATVKASELIKIFKTMASEKWKYVAGGTTKGKVDCSGAFYYAYKQLGGYMYHGSNTMWRKYSTEKGKIGSIDLVPGMPVYKIRDWTSSQSDNGWYNNEPGDVYHVGMYIGNDQVVEAKGTKYGVVISKLSTWTHASRLKDTEYDIGNEQAEVSQDEYPTSGAVSISSGWLNVRTAPDSAGERLGKLYNGDIVVITGEVPGWYQIEYNGKTAYASMDYIDKVTEDIQEYVITVSIISKTKLNEVMDVLENIGCSPLVTRRR